jgi:hypothetical protein
MRKVNVFGQKQSQVRPFYVLIFIFVLLVPAYLVMNYFQESRLETLEDEASSLQADINRYIRLSNQEEEIIITEGMVDGGFAYYRFDYYIQEEIITLIESSNLVYESDDSITITDVETPPISVDVPEDIQVKKIDIIFTINSESNYINFLTTLLEDDQLYYIDSVNIISLETGEFRVTTSIYGFYQTNQ